MAPSNLLSASSPDPMVMQNGELDDGIGVSSSVLVTVASLNSSTPLATELTVRDVLNMSGIN